MRVSGFISAPALSRANRSDMTIFVNGRWVQDRGLNTAVLQAYHTLLMVGRYPLCILRVELNPEDVDVNVHPAKTEVRFRNNDVIFRVVQRTVRRTLIDHAPIPQVQPSTPVSAWQPTFDTHDDSRRGAAGTIASVAAGAVDQLIRDQGSGIRDQRKRSGQRYRSQRSTVCTRSAISTQQSPIASQPTTALARDRPDRRDVHHHRRAGGDVSDRSARRARTRVVREVHGRQDRAAPRRAEPARSDPAGVFTR